MEVGQAKIRSSSGADDRRAVGDAIIVEKDPGAGRDAGVRTGVSLSETESAGSGNTAAVPAAAAAPAAAQLQRQGHGGIVGF
mmetsp:Transcript_5713/g.13254  ORF Transcript_5713/g.13254 Transcript_5713/m.13254 type:complete len:82 (+) Transcript_5713:379-624(+)